MRSGPCRSFIPSQLIRAMEIEAGALDRLRGRVSYWAKQLSLQPRTVRVQPMTRKWGSCSTAGTITLAADLAGCEERLQDVVIVHELLHLRVQNHGRLFRVLMTTHVPHWREIAGADRRPA